MSKANRLANEKSPYLLQHAANPVDWYPWGEEAFAKAQQENKPVFLSIGYSTCHWCHVMAHESFEDAQTADILNTHFVAIKVDREERPDIDQIYMTAVTSLTGQGGWPLSVFLTPQKNPFYGGTYFPPEPRWGSPGVKQLLLSVAENWKTPHSEIIASCESLTGALKKRMRFEAREGVTLGEGTLALAYQGFLRNFDSELGGFGQAPKFPMGHSLTFLLRYWKRSGEAQALKMVTRTLDEMAKGGMYDQLGGGFHRYSTDAAWQVPHFEKMLYDQALLVRAYLEGYQASGNESYAVTAAEILDYVRREMTSPEGGFYSAEDADSADPEFDGEKREGTFYLWRAAEIEDILKPVDAKIFNYYYGVESDGNAKQDPHGEFTGKNVLYINHSIGETAKKFDLPVSEVTHVLQKARKRLFNVRGKRVRPHLDDKILTDWNGLMISAFALGAKVLDNEGYREAACRSADFILARLIKDDGPDSAAGTGRLLHRYREGDAAISGNLEDYAFLIDGLLELYEVTFDVKYLQAASRLADEMIRLFGDADGGGFFFTAVDGEELIFRNKEVYDGAVPSGNSVAADVLLRLARIRLDTGLEEKVNSLMKTFAPEVSRHPNAYARLLTALDFALGPSYEIVLAADKDDPQLPEFIRTVYGVYLPNKVVLLHPATPAEAKAVEALAPFIKQQGRLDNQITAYVCRNYQCRLPVHDAVAFKSQLAN